MKHDEYILVTGFSFNQMCTQYFHSWRPLFKLSIPGLDTYSVGTRTWAGFWADLGPGSQGTSKSVSVWGRYFQLSWISKSLEADSLTSHSQLVSSCLCERHPLPAPAGFQLSYWTTNLRIKTMVWLITLEGLPAPLCSNYGLHIPGKASQRAKFPLPSAPDISVHQGNILMARNVLSADYATDTCTTCTVWE